ncbi:Carbonic anhydrase precursor [Corynebacterium renale]|uniref:carbonic anhydrase n=1 Tax=Corynebacterium renale TaxID=1724 RepID=UPI000DA2B022|nr:carbonic anhydrase family protein [Corynebacterium renale]SQG64571.1 Carbonic anhydrase precursor [Corynebacterium renale]
MSLDQRRTAFFAAPVAAALLLAGCTAEDTATETTTTQTSTSVAKATDVHWGYTAEGAPEHWGELSEEYATCGTGTEQSPIDLTGATPEDLDDLTFAYTPSGGEVLNNGHTLQFTPATSQKVTLAGEELELVQLHMHTPSEHHIDGKQLPGEIHLVHKNADGDLTVLGIMLADGAANDLVQYLLDNAPAQADATTDVTEELDIAALLPAKQEYITYAGSLTTPPCTENVRWIVMTQPVEASAEQLAAFEKLIGANARPVQEHGDRELTLDATS